MLQCHEITDESDSGNQTEPADEPKDDEYNFHVGDFVRVDEKLMKHPSGNVFRIVGVNYDSVVISICGAAYTIHDCDYDSLSKVDIKFSEEEPLHTTDEPTEYEYGFHEGDFVRMDEELASKARASSLVHYKVAKVELTYIIVDIGYGYAYIEQSDYHHLTKVDAPSHTTDEQAPYEVRYIAEAPKQSVDKVKRFDEIAKEMTDLYKRKNSDYGDSFGDSVREFGVIAGVVRISDKFNRLKSLIKKGNQEVKDESLIDTLTDMANYCIMLRMEIEKGSLRADNGEDEV